MAMTQAEKDMAYRERLKEAGLTKISVIFPTMFKKRLVDFAAKNKAEWEQLRDTGK